jgi:hypothetical protein
VRANVNIGYYQQEWMDEGSGRAGVRQPQNFTAAMTLYPGDQIASRADSTSAVPWVF